jgi:hypothetical protein
MNRITKYLIALVVAFGVAFAATPVERVSAWDSGWGSTGTSDWGSTGSGWGSTGSDWGSSGSWDSGWGSSGSNWGSSGSWDSGWGSTGSDWGSSGSWDSGWGSTGSGWGSTGSWDSGWGSTGSDWGSSSWDSGWGSTGSDWGSTGSSDWGSTAWDSGWGSSDWDSDWGSSSWDSGWGSTGSDWGSTASADWGSSNDWDSGWGSTTYGDDWGSTESWDSGWGSTSYGDAYEGQIACANCGWDSGWGGGWDALYDTAPIIYQGYDTGCGWSGCGGNGGNGGGSVIVNSTNNNNNSNTNNNNNTIVLGGNEGNNNDDDEDDLSVVCRVSDTSIEEGDRVTYEVEIDGGNSPFDVDWSGDVDGSGRSITARYTKSGRYEARVTVTDDEGNRASDDCADVIVDDEDNNDDDDDFSVLCRVSDTSVEEGDRVTFEVEIDGGERPFEIRWSGDLENKSRYNDEDEIRVTFDDNGRYEVRVTVEDDDGNEDSDNCALVRVSNEDDDNNRSGATLISNPPAGTPASASSVYLSQVPYTGAEDVLAFVALSLLAVAVAGYAVFRKAKNASVVSRKEAIDRVKAENLASRIA